MSIYSDLLAVLKYVGARTGDPTAWQVGLTPDEVAAVVTPWTSSAQLDAIVAKIRRQHPDLFGLPAPAPPGEPQQGAAAEAIAAAEAALAHQNSADAQLDLQVISAILNAHERTVESSAALKKLQQETEAAVRTRSDLDTPAGARDFQRFLIGKLRDIRAVVASASLDDTSKSALLAAWTSLYNASKTGPGVLDEPREGRDRRDRRPEPSVPAEYPDPLMPDDADLLAGDSPASGATAGPTAGAAAPMLPTTPTMPSIPSLGTGSVPGGSSLPASGPGLNSAGGLPLSRLLGGGAEHDPTDIEELKPAKDRASSDEPDPNEHNGDEGDQAASGDKREQAPPVPTTVTLPDGETVTAASPQIAAAIKAAIGGVPIVDAFRQQGINIPAPGTAVSAPVDPARLTPGDVGMFTDRHALAVGHTKALLDGQIQPISSVTGPSFLGWEHPPAALAATSPGPRQTERPTPTRPA
jgi:hypothetical protein